MNQPESPTTPDTSPSPPQDEPEIEVFRTGDYGAKGQYQISDLESLARDYDRSRLDAPLTLDHAQSGPAHGWVASLRRTGDRLLARITGLGREIRQLVAQGAYRRCSIELLRKHPETGRPYLRAVTLLGAATPAVTGLEPVRFHDEDPPFLPTPPPDPASETSPQPQPEGTESPDPAPALRSALQTIADLRHQLATLQQETFSQDTRRLVHQLRAAGMALAPDAEDRILAFAAEHQLTQPGRPLLDWIQSLFDQATPPVPLGPVQPGSASLPTGTILPQSRDLATTATAFAAGSPPPALHSEALRLMGLHPGLGYTQALIQAARP